MSYGQYSANHGAGDAPKHPRSRVKHVFSNNDEIAHLWFSQSQDSARNQQSNFFFEGETIYSYGSHFPIAVLGEFKGKKYVFETVQWYSNTTGGHKRAVFSAIRVWNGDTHVPAEGWTIFEVINPLRSVQQILAEFKERIEKAQLNACTPKHIRQTTRARLYSTCMDLIQDANRFCEFFELKQRFEVPSDFESMRLELAAAKAKADRLAEIARKQREREQQKKLDAIREQVVPQWLAGGLPYIEVQVDRYSTLDVRNLPEAYLRLTPNDPCTIETSQHAKVPLFHVMKALPVVLAIIRTGRTYQRNGHTIHLGHYAIDRIEADGTLIAGCHRFEKTEILRFAAVLNALEQRAEQTEQIEASK